MRPRLRPTSSLQGKKKKGTQTETEIGTDLLSEGDEEEEDEEFMVFH